MERLSLPRLKKAIIWNSFKQRIEQSEFIDMFFDLTSMIQRHEGLTHLEDQFSTAEIDEVVKSSPMIIPLVQLVSVMSSSRNVEQP